MAIAPLPTRPINRRTVLHLGFLALGSCMVACSPEAKQTWADLKTLGSRLQTEYPDDEIQVNLWNGNAINVGFLNSDISDLPDTERYAAAQSIASVAYANYPGKMPPSSVTITFTIHKRYFGVVSYTNSLDTYRFSIDELTPITP